MVFTQNVNWSKICFCTKDTVKYQSKSGLIKKIAFGKQSHTI